MEEIMDELAVQWVSRALRSSIPAQIPLPFSRILAARFLKRKRKTVGATLELVTGNKAVIEVSTWIDVEDAWTYRWIENDGLPIWWNGEKWIEIDMFGDQFSFDLEAIT